MATLSGCAQGSDHPARSEVTAATPTPVGKNAVTNPFSAGEVYVRQGGQWQLASLAFSHLLRD